MSDYEITVDNRDIVIGQKHWREMSHDNIYRVSALWLTDTKTGDILLAQRKWTKKNDPGKWGPAVSGTIEVGETYESNIVKEIEEEIGLTNLKLHKGPKTYTDDGEHRFFCQWFIATVHKDEVTIVIQEDEVEAVDWISKSNLLNDLAKNSDKYTPSTTENLQALGVL